MSSHLVLNMVSPPFQTFKYTKRVRLHYKIYYFSLKILNNTYWWHIYLRFQSHNIINNTYCFYCSHMIFLIICAPMRRPWEILMMSSQMYIVICFTSRGKFYNSYLPNIEIMEGDQSCTPLAWMNQNNLG